MVTGSDLPTVAVVGTGGSISTIGRHSLDLYEYGDFGRVVGIDELLDLVPEARSHAVVVPIPLRAAPSTAFGPQDWLEFRHVIQRTIDMGQVTGVVVTHGTSTLEETAYFLHLTLKSDLPVVLVGAQRPANGLSSDAGLNLVNAIRVAGTPEARGLGVLVTLNGEIHSAREVSKTSNYHLDAFRSPGVGPLGAADPDAIVFFRTPMRRHAPDTVFDVAGLPVLPRVDISYSYAGCDGAAVRAFVAAGAKAIVSAGLPPGKVSPAEDRAFLDAHESGVVIVRSSRAGSGRVLSRGKLQDQGIVAAGDLNPQKARVLAMLAITVTHDHGEIQQMFREY